MNPKITISYSTNDNNCLDKFNSHFSGYCNRKELSIYRTSHYLGTIDPIQLRNTFASSDIIIVILTANYLKDCEKEIKLLQSIDDNEIKIIPIKLSNCYYEESFLDEFKILDIENFKNEDDLMVSLLSTIEDLRKNYQEAKIISLNTNKYFEFVRAGYPLEETIDNNKQIPEILTINKIIGNTSVNEKQFTIRGRSMEPKYFDGESILCRNITDDILTSNPSEKISSFKNLIDKKKAYVVETKSVGLVLKKIELKNGVIRLSSFNSDYPIEDIAINELISVWKIISA